MATSANKITLIPTKGLPPASAVPNGGITNIYDPNDKKDKKIDLGKLGDKAIVELSTNLDPATANIHYLVDASGGDIIIYLPAVVAGNKDRFIFTLKENSNHCNISVKGGGQLIGSKSVLNLATVNAQVVIQANGVDGYYILSDDREYYRVIEFSSNLYLTNGIESGALYVGFPASGTEIVVTVKNWTSDYKGEFCKFIKGSGVNSSVRVVSEDTTFDELIITDDTGFELIYGASGFRKGQNSRISEALVTLYFYPTTSLSTIEGTYYKLVNNSEDPSYNNPAAIFSTPPITSITDQSVGFFINDAKALSGLVAERGILAAAQIKLQTTYNRQAAIKFRYYEYDIPTLTLNPIPLAETSYSEFISSTTTLEKFVSGLLPTNDWTNKTLVIELIAKKSATVGDNPIIDFTFGGVSPSKTTIDLPATGVSHDSLPGKSIANPSISFGHVDNKYPFQTPQLSQTEIDALSLTAANAGMIVHNTTVDVRQVWNGSAWLNDDGSGEGLPFLLSQIDLSSTVQANPGTGKLRFNNANQSLVTALYINDSEYDNGLIEDFVSKLSTGSIFALKNKGDRTKWVNYEVVSIVDNTGYWTINVTVKNKGTDFVDLDICGIIINSFDQSLYNEIKTSSELQWQFDTVTTKGDPGSGKFRRNATGTELYVNLVNYLGKDLYPILSVLKSGAAIYAQCRTSTSRYLVGFLSGDSVSEGSYYTIPISAGSYGAFSLDDIVGFVFINIPGTGGGSASPEWALNAASAWDGSSRSPDMALSDVDEWPINNGTTTLTFANPTNVSTTVGRKKYVVIDNSGNASAITSISWGANYNFVAGSRITGIAANSKYLLELFNNLGTIRCDINPDE